MDLWIRSQDKRKLKKVSILEVEKMVDGPAIISSEAYSLGEYKTKERALEVLDEISYIMLPTKDGFDENGVYDSSNCFATEKMMYYEMPES